MSAEHLDHLEADFQGTMESLKATVQSKTAVPTAQVYVSYTFLSLSLAPYFPPTTPSYFFVYHSRCFSLN